MGYFFDPEKFKVARQIKSLSQQEMASVIGVSPQTISNIETGKTIPNIETLLKICNEYGFHPRFFFDETVGQ